MTRQREREVRNLAIVAHVDHGKTTVADALLWQTEALARDPQCEARLLDLFDPDREKTVARMPAWMSLQFGDARLNLLDLPGRVTPDRAERIVRMAEGLLFVVDACEGPAAPTRFALGAALAAGLTPVVVLNKVDRPGARPGDVLEEVRQTFRDLDAEAAQLDFPVLYTEAVRGVSRATPAAADDSLVPLLRTILSAVPAPDEDAGAALQALVTGFAYDEFLGRLGLARVFGGRLLRGGEVDHCRLDGRIVRGTVAGLYGYEGLRRVEVSEAGPGDVVELAGVESLRIGETLGTPGAAAPLPPLRADEPTIGVPVSVNDSPLAGPDDRFVAAERLRERLWSELLADDAIRVEETDSPERFLVWLRGELQLAILVEMMRREGFELLVGRPEIALRDEDGQRQEPLERVTVDCTDAYAAVVSQKLEARGGRQTRMVNHGLGRARLEFRVPARGLIGFRAELIRDTKGSGILWHRFDGYGAWAGEIRRRTTGSLVADRDGRCTAWALEHLQHRGSLFVSPGDEVYGGMVVGENSREADLEVNVCKPRPSDEPAALSMPLIPARSLSVEQALEFIRDDELVEVTPPAIRLRKRDLRGVSGSDVGA